MKKVKRIQRHQRIRKIISGTTERPRLAVFRSTQHIYAQIIDDVKGITIVSATDLGLKSGTKKERALMVGETVAKAAIEKKIKQVVFDRGGFEYHGRVMALAEGARKGGLDF